MNSCDLQTPNPNYYSTLAKFKFLQTGQTSGGLNTPADPHGLMSTMVGTTVTGGNQIQPNHLLMMTGLESQNPEQPKVIFNQHRYDDFNSCNNIK